MTDAPLDQNARVLEQTRLRRLEREQRIASLSELAWIENAREAGRRRDRVTWDVAFAAGYLAGRAYR